MATYDTTARNATYSVYQSKSVNAGNIDSLTARKGKYNRIRGVR